MQINGICKYVVSVSADAEWKIGKVGEFGTLILLHESLNASLSNAESTHRFGQCNASRTGSLYNFFGLLRWYVSMYLLQKIIGDLSIGDLCELPVSFASPRRADV